MGKLTKILLPVALLLLVLTACTTVPQEKGVSSKAPAVPSGMVRLNYHRFDDKYTGWGIHAWGSGYAGDEVQWTSPLAISGTTSYGVYWDIPYSGNGELNFIIHNGDTKDPDGDRTFPGVEGINEYWAISGDDTAYNRLKLAQASLNNKILSSVAVSNKEISITFRAPNEKDITVSVDGENVPVESVSLLKRRTYIIKMTDVLDATKDYVVESGTMNKKVRFSWQSTDSSFSYDGELGAIYTKESTNFKLWTPFASEVILSLYKDGQDKEPYQTENLTKGDRGVWNSVVEGDLQGVFYSYDVTNNGKKKRVLDPYAKTMAAFNSNKEPVGRGAVIDTALVGPALDYAKIDGYTKKEDAVIWEIHVRDFTSDPSLKTEAQFGTYKAFIEKLDYIKSLGVTHVQLLPVLNYYFGDETDSATRESQYSAGGNNYNWGYDPHNYFSPEGMYSEDATDPLLRVAELKELIKAIHDNGMGVILDVVYNHTAKIGIFENIVPGYYHFMDKNGKAKSSYGGGRLGTTHYMTRKLVVDSIKHWTDEYKVDGFRFDLMGDLDAETVQIAFDEAEKLNPNMLMIGEGWRTYAGDDNDKRTPADQSWMADTDAAACFSDELRNELKSGYGSEGKPRFMTGGKRDINVIFNNVSGRPGNMTLNDPGDVVQYVAAHDNLPLHDVIAQSINKDPDLHEDEIQKRIRLTNTMVLTSQGVAFLHAGQEYGRTKQWRTDGKPTVKGTKVKGFKYPWFVHDSYDSSDPINMIDWTAIESGDLQKETIEYTKKLIALRRSTDAFRLGTAALVKTNVKLVKASGIEKKDNMIIYTSTSTTGEEYYVIINADSKVRVVGVDVDITAGDILLESNPSGIEISADKITVQPLTAVVVKTK